MLDETPVCWVELYYVGQNSSLVDNSGMLDGTSYAG